MDYNFYYNTVPPSYAYPSEHNVYISNYFIGHTTVEGTYCPNYTTPPPFQFPFPNKHADLPTKHPSTPTEEGSVHHQQTVAADPPYTSTYTAPPGDKTAVPAYTATTSDYSSFSQELGDVGAFSFNVWQNLKEEPQEVSSGDHHDPAYSSDLHHHRVPPQCTTQGVTTTTSSQSNTPPEQRYHSIGGNSKQSKHKVQQHHVTLNDHTISNEFTAQFHTDIHASDDDMEENLISTIQEAERAKDYKRVMELIAKHQFSAEHHDELQKLWLSAVYSFAKMKRGKAPNAVDRYRLRKKYPFPVTVWNGEKKLYTYKESARNSLEDFYNSNKYPTPDQKRELSEICNLTYMQVCNWFKNKRMRGKADTRSHSDAAQPGNEFIHPHTYSYSN